MNHLVKARAGEPTTGKDAARRPLSPLLSNMMLDDSYKKLERRGHWFCRYADNRNLYVQSRRTGEPVLVSIIAFLTQRLKLKVHEEKARSTDCGTAPFWGTRYCLENHPACESRRNR